MLWQNSEPGSLSFEIVGALALDPYAARLALGLGSYAARLWHWLGLDSYAARLWHCQPKRLPLLLAAAAKMEPEQQGDCQVDQQGLQAVWQQAGCQTVWSGCWAASFHRHDCLAGAGQAGSLN